MNPDVDPFQELAELFLTQPDGDPLPEANGRTRPDGREGTDDTSARAAEVELVVVGSLPVRASLWIGICEGASSASR